MAAIPTNMGEGGANVAHTEGGSPTIASALRDAADDLATLTPVTLVQVDATDLAEALLLVNEIKAMLNTIAGSTILTTKA